MPSKVSNKDRNIYSVLIALLSAGAITGCHLTRYDAWRGALGVVLIVICCISMGWYSRTYWEIKIGVWNIIERIRGEEVDGRKEEAVPNS